MITVSENNYHLTKLQKCQQHNVDMHVISEVSKLTWEAIEKDFSLEQFRYQLEQIVKKKNKYTSFIINLGAALACVELAKCLAVI